MKKQYSIAEARNRFPAIVHDAEKGAAIEITRRGRPVAVLISASAWQHLEKGRADLWKALEDFRQRHDLAALGIDEVLDVRDRSPGREIQW